MKRINLRVGMNEEMRNRHVGQGGTVNIAWPADFRYIPDAQSTQNRKEKDQETRSESKLGRNSSGWRDSWLEN